MAEAKETLFERAKRRIKHAQDVEAQQRENEKDDLRFQVPELQWDDAARKQREGSQSGGAPTPARPCLSVSLLDQPIQIVENQERSSKLGVSIIPVSSEASDETATILEGIYRRIERDSQAHTARSWAFSRAIRAGRGFYRILTKFADEYGDSSPEAQFDQVICIERILDQGNVYLDPAATKPDYSDGEWGAIGTWVPVSTFEREFPKAEKTGAETHEFRDMSSEEPNWVKGSNSKDGALFVVEYWEKQHNTETITVGDQTREKDKVTLTYAKLSGFEELESQEVDGRYIPIVPVIGRELIPFDDQRRWTGIIGPAKDSQRGYNYSISQAIETAALEPKAPYILDPKQIEGYESWWQQSNMRSFPYLPAHATVDGQPVAAPQRSQIDAGRLGLSLQLGQLFNQGVQTTTATYDPSLGRTSSREKSGRAIMALQQQGDQTNSHFMSNLADISMQYEARVILDLIPYIYDRPGRMARTLSEEGESDTVMLNQPYSKGPDGKPIPAPQPPPGAPGMAPTGPGPMVGPQMPPMAPQGPPGMAPGAMPQAPPVKNYDLRKGVYTVAVSIGKTQQTAMQEAADQIGQILQAQPNLMPILGPEFFENRAFPGAKKLAKLLRKMRDQQMPFLKDDEAGKEQTPEALASENAQLKAKLEEMGQIMQKMEGDIKTDQAKAAASVESARMGAEASVTKAQIDAASRVEQTKIKADADARLEMLLAQVKELLAKQQMDHDSVENQKDRDHDTMTKVAEAAMKPPDLSFRGSSDVELPLDEEI